MDTLRFLTPEQIHEIREWYETPVFIYSERILREQAQKVVNFPHHFGLTPRYAMKTSSNMNLLRIFSSEGLHIDASSGYEVMRAIHAGIPPNHIQLTGQEMPRDLEKIVKMWVEFNATSLYQLETYGKLFPWTEASIRINPGMGSWGTNRTNVGWPASSFGIWHEYLDEAKSTAEKYSLTITKLHTHIWSGSDPEVWKTVAGLVLRVVEKLPHVTIVSLGWGFKVARMDYEKTAHLEEIGNHVKWLFLEFAEKTRRKLHLEVEPGTFLAANSASLITEVIDIVDTGEDGYNFIKVNSGMTEVTRPSLYGAQHPIIVIPNMQNPEDSQKQGVRGREIFSKGVYSSVDDWENNLSNKENRSFSESSYIVVGHNCESGDIFTTAPGDPEWLLPRTLTEARIWDGIVIESVWSYCASMSTHGYNSFPEAGELLLREDGAIVEIRKRAESAELWRNEIPIV